MWSSDAAASHPHGFGRGRAQYPCSRAAQSPHGKASHSLCPDRHFPALGRYFHFTQKNHKTFLEIRGHYFILYFKKELLTTWLLYFLFTFHPFHSLSPPKILFAFLIRPIHQEKALRELVVTVPRSFSWVESINLHPWE